MSFIKIYPLREAMSSSEDFGRGNPARCQVEHGFSAPEYYLNVHEISAFEICPLYLIAAHEADGLIDGVRLRLCSGEVLVIPDDTEEPDQGFLSLLGKALSGECVEMAPSPYLRALLKRR